MSLSRRMKKVALRANLKAAANKNGASNSQFGKAIEEQEDSYLANILGSINKSSFMKKVLYNAIGLTLMAATPNFAGEITGVSGTSVVKDGTTYTINTADANFKGNTAFNAFKQFQLDNGEIANMMVGKTTKTGIDNVVNFVGSQVNINGVLNTIKVLDAQNTQKLGGNLYFLSSEGLVIGSTGVVNTGSFYAIVPNKEFMDKFIEFKDQNGNLVDNPAFKDGSLLAPNDDYQATGQQAVVNNIIDAIGKVSEGFDGITLDEKGSITINGKINAKNNIKLFAARKYDANANSAEQAANIIIGPDAQLNVLSKDVFGSYVNLTNEEFVEDGEFQVNAVAGVYIQSVGFKGENATSGGYANGIKTEGVINSRSTVQMVSSNYFGQNGDNGTDISDVRGNISLSGKINAPDGVFVQAQNGDINLSDKAVVANNQTTYKSAEIRSKILHLTTFHGDIKNSVHEGNDTDHQLVDNFEHNDYYTSYFVNAHDGEVNLSKTNIDSGNATLVVTATKGIALKNVTTNSGRIEINNSINHGEYTNEVSGNITVTGNLSTNLKNNDTNNQLVQGVGLIQVSNEAANSNITEGEYMPQRDLNINLTNVSATNVNIKAYGDVEVANITGSENTNEYVQNDIHIKAANNLNVAGTIETFNGDITIEAGNVATINSVNANGELKVDADSIDKINAEAQRIKIFTNKGANIGTLKSKTDSNDGNIGPIFVQNRSKADLYPAFENLTTALDKYKEFMERAIAMVDKLIELHPEDDSLRGIKGDLESQLIDFDRFRRYGDEGAKIDYYSDSSNYGYSNFEYKYKSVVMNAENVLSQYQSLLENSNYQSDLSNEDVASLMTAARTAYSDATARWEVAKVSDVTLPTTAPTGNITLAGEIDARNAGTETKKGYVTVENFGGNIILGTSETPAIIKGAAVTLTAKAIEDVVDGPTSSITTTEKSVKAGMAYDQNPTFFTATNGNITLTNTELTLRSGLIAEANGSVTLSKLKSYNNIVDDPNVVIVKANSGITTNSFSATGENEVSLENTKVVYDYEQALDDLKTIYDTIKDNNNVSGEIKEYISNYLQEAEISLNNNIVAEVVYSLDDGFNYCNGEQVKSVLIEAGVTSIPANMEVYATKPSGAVTVGDVKNTLNSNSGDINIINDGGKIVVNGDINGNSVNLSSVGHENSKIELNNSEMQVGNITMTAKGIEDAENTTNSIKANNSGDSMSPVMTLTATDGDIALNNTKLNASNGKMLVKAEKGSVTIEDEVKARELELTSAKGVTLGDVTTYSGLMQVTNSNAIKVFDYALCYDDINSVWDSIEGRINGLNNILQLVSGQDIATEISVIITNLNTDLNNIKTKAQAQEDVSQDWANARDNLSYLSIKISQLSSVLSQMVYGYEQEEDFEAAGRCENANNLLMNEDGINTFINGLKNNTITEAKLESYNVVTQTFNEAVTLKGAINAHTSDENHLGTVEITNNGGDVVLNNATINAGKVDISADGIDDAESTTNSITANNQQGESLFLTAYNGDIDLSNTTLKASDCTLSASSFAGAVKIANDMEVGNVNVYAHSGIEVGNISAIKQYGIHMENTRVTWDETSVDNAIQYLETVVTDDIKNADSFNAGYLEQYMERAKEYRDKGDFENAGLYIRTAFNILNNSIYTVNHDALPEKPDYEQFMVYPTGDIKAGDLTAQYVQDNETKFGPIKINNTSDDVIGGKSLPDANRNVILSNVTGGKVSIGAMGAITVDPDSESTISGEFLTLSANSVDVDKIEGEAASINADNIKANSINLTADLSIGEMAPVGTAEIGSIEAASVNINTNQGATYGNITITENNGEGSDNQNQISISNVNKYDFEKINESYTAILNSLSSDDRDAVENEFMYSLASAIESRNGELALEELAGAYQMATGYEADLSGISVDPEEYITEAQNDITLKGAFQLSEENESEAEFSVNVYNEGGNITLDGAAIDADTISLAGVGIKDTAETTNSIIANSDSEEEVALYVSATGNISLENTDLMSNGTVGIEANKITNLSDVQGSTIEIATQEGAVIGNVTATSVDENGNSIAIFNAVPEESIEENNQENEQQLQIEHLQLIGPGSLRAQDAETEQVGNDIVINGTVKAPSEGEDAGKAIIRNDAGSIIVNGDVSAENIDIDANDSVEVAGNAQAEEKIDINAEKGDVAIANASAEEINVDAGRDINIESANASTMLAMAGNDINIADAEVSETMALMADNDINLESAKSPEMNLLAGNDINVNANGDIAMTNIGAGANANINVEGNLTVSNEVSAGKALTIEANSVEFNGIEAGSANITTKAGANIGDISSTGSGEGYEVEINNTESGNIEIGNVNVVGEAKINNDAAEGNVKGANVYVRTLNELTAGNVEATSSSNNTLESPERGALYLEGANLNYASAKSAGNSMEIDSTHAEVVIDGVVSKIYMGEPIIEEGVDVYTFRSDITDIPETMKESLEILKATGKIIPVGGTDIDVAEIARAMLRNQQDKSETMEQNDTENRQEIDLNLNASLDLGGDIEGLDVEADDTAEERLQIAMNEDGNFELVGKEDNENNVQGEDDEEEKKKRERAETSN